ncbi:MAG: hypothetical protein HY996_10170 [Micrococcales bacterium]|nr:hypothetical protein [Micrococcales bacterium]
MSSSTRARRARPWGGAPRSAAVPTVLLLIAPLLVLIVAAVLFGTGARPRSRARAAADVAAVPASASGRTAPVVDSLRRTPRVPRATRRALVALRPTSGRALAGAAAIAVGVLVASTSALGSFALLNSRSTIGSGITLTAGTLGLAINGSSSATAIPLPAGFAKLLPGTYFSQPITVANSGNTPGTVSAVLAAVPAPYEVRLAASPCPSTGYGTSTLSAPTLSTAATSYGTLPASSTVTGCLQIGLAAAAPAAGNGTGSVTAQTSSASFALTFTATEPSA